MTVAKVKTLEPPVDASPEISVAVGGDPPRTIPVKGPDEERTVPDEKYGSPPLVPARPTLSVPEVVTGDPETEKMPDDNPPLMVSPTLVTVPVPPLAIPIADWDVTRPLPLVVTWQTWVASPQEPGALLTVAKVNATEPAGLVTSPVCAGSADAGNTPVVRSLALTVTFEDRAWPLTVVVVGT